MNNLDSFIRLTPDQYRPLNSSIGILSVASSVSAEHAYKHLAVTLRTFVCNAKNKDNSTVSWKLFVRLPMHMVSVDESVYKYPLQVKDLDLVSGAIANAFGGLNADFSNECFEVISIHYVPRIEAKKEIVHG